MTEADRVAGIARGLTRAQREAVLKLPFSSTTAQPAGDLKLSGSTLMSLNGVGGVDPKTLELGPILATYERMDWDGKRHWWLTPLGLAVRQFLASQGEGK